MESPGVGPSGNAPAREAKASPPRPKAPAMLSPFISPDEPLKTKVSPALGVGLALPTAQLPDAAQPVVAVATPAPLQVSVPTAANPAEAAIRSMSNSRARTGIDARFVDGELFERN